MTKKKTGRIIEVNNGIKESYTFDLDYYEKMDEDPFEEGIFFKNYNIILELKRGQMFIIHSSSHTYKERLNNISLSKIPTKILFESNDNISTLTLGKFKIKFEGEKVVKIKKRILFPFKLKEQYMY